MELPRTDWNIYERLASIFSSLLDTLDRNSVTGILPFAVLLRKLYIPAEILMPIQKEYILGIFSKVPIFVEYPRLGIF